MIDAPLPPEMSAAVRATFGDAPLDQLSPIHAGMSGATVFSFDVAGAPYIVRRGAAERAPREFACLRIASEAGVAPRLHYADVATGVCILERVPGGRLGQSGPDPTRIARVAAVLRTLHRGPAFPKGMTYREILGWADGQMRALTGDGVHPDVTSTLDAVSPSLARYAETAPCHNDLNPGNILEAGPRIVFVDWETASMGDPFIDVAQLGVFAFRQPVDRQALLGTYLGRPPTQEEAARIAVARVVALGFYAASFGLVHATMTRAPLPSSDGALPLDDLFQEMLAQKAALDPGRMAASLRFEMLRERNSDEVEASQEFLAQFQ